MPTVCAMRIAAGKGDIAARCNDELLGWYYAVSDCNCFTGRSRVDFSGDAE